jgi:hypothetical protein
MVKYDQSTIYKLCCKDLSITDIYIGSTTNFNRRKNAHKSICNNEKSKDHNLYVYQFIRENGGFQNWSMVEIELFNARDKKNLIRRERHWIENEKAALNSIKSCITEEEIKEYQAEYQAEYRANNVDEIKEYKAKYYAENADKIKEYYAENADKIKETSAKYYAENADKIKEKTQCECGSVIAKGSLSRHLKTKKHQTFLEQQPSTL